MTLTQNIWLELKIISEDLSKLNIQEKKWYLREIRRYLHKSKKREDSLYSIDSDDWAQLAVTDMQF